MQVSKFVLGIIVGIVVVFGGVYTYFMRGLAPVATSAAPMPFEKQFAKGALHAHVNREMPKDVPLPWNEANLVAGAQVYKQHCAVCHGLPGQEQTAIAKGMFPKPPKLMEGVGVTDDPPQESFWKVQNGIRMTGMPGFQNTLTNSELWQVSLMLANANKLPQSAKDALSATMSAPLEPPQRASKPLRR
jgi:mono/diheme cytochrome c family protein